MKQKIWDDAVGIAWTGASNPAGVALTIHEDLASLYRSGMGTDEAARHPAIRAMVGHLAYLCGIGLGPDEAAMKALLEYQHAAIS